MWYPRRQPSINLLHVDGKILLLFMTELVSTIITWFYFLYIKNPEFISNTGIPVRLVLGHASRKIHIMKDARCYIWGMKFVLNGRSLILNNCFCHWCNWKCLYLPEETFKYDKLIKTHEGKPLKCILFSVIGFTPVYIDSLQLHVILIHKSNYLYITVLFYFLRWCVFTQCLFWPSYNCLDLPFTSVVFTVSYVARKENLGYQVLKLNLAW